MGPEALPPYRSISSTPISNEAASDILATYISNSELHPHLHPDALITPTGVQFGSHGGPTGGVVMHNLRRVAAGLRGEHLEPEPSPEPEEREGQDGKPFKKGKKTQFEETTGDVAAVADEEWQDKSDYERQEGVVEVGEIGDRDNFVTSGGDIPEVEGDDGAHEEAGQKRKSKIDKEARKKAKKARSQETKKSVSNKKTSKAD